MDDKIEFVKNRFLSLLSKNRPEWMPSRSILRAMSKKAKNKNRQSILNVKGSIFSRIPTNFGFPGMNRNLPTEAFGGVNNNISNQSNNSSHGIILQLT